MRKIPLKNYLIYLVICIITFALLFFFVARVHNMEIEKKSDLSGFVHQLPNEDTLINLKNYAIDNPNFFLYISNHNGGSSFEKDFKNYILSCNLKESIVYLNGWNKLNTKFVKNFKNDLFDYSVKNVDIFALMQSNIYEFKDGMVVNILYKNKKSINIEDAKKFIESSGDVSA